MSAVTNASPRARKAGSGDWREWLARFGLVGKGVLHLVVGYAVWRLANNTGSGAEASSSGAVGWIADLPAGSILLWVLAASLASLALWRAVETVAGDPVDDDDAVHRIAFAAKALVYAALAALCVRTAVSGDNQQSSGSGSDDGSAQEAASTVFDLPMGRWIVFAVGLGIMAVAVHLIAVHTIDGKFLKRLSVGERTTAARSGRVGYGLRSVAYVMVGYFLAAAGVTYEPDRVDGLSGSLRRAAREPWGPWVLTSVAVGFVTYGIYCFFESALRRDA